MKKCCPKCYSTRINYATTRPECTVCGWVCDLADLLREPAIVNPPKLKYVSIDIETTGLDPETCQILEFGAIIEDWKSPVANLPRFRRVLKYDEIVGEPYGLSMNAELLKFIGSTPVGGDILCHPNDLEESFTLWLLGNGFSLKNVQAAGKNFGTFDLQFLRRLFRTVTFNHRVIDPGLLYWRDEDAGLPSTKVCMERAEIEGKVAHTAVEDAEAVIKMIRYYWNNIGPI